MDLRAGRVAEAAIIELPFAVFSTPEDASKLLLNLVEDYAVTNPEIGD